MNPIPFESNKEMISNDPHPGKNSGGVTLPTGQSDTFPNPESCGTCFWGAGETGGKADLAGYWPVQGESQGGIEESGLQLGSILRVGWNLSAQGRSKIAKSRSKEQFR